MRLFVSVCLLLGPLEVFSQPASGAATQPGVSEARCEDLFARQEWGEAASCYAKLYGQDKQHPNAVKMLDNMAIAAEDAKEIDLAIAAREALIHDPVFASTPEGRTSIFALGRLHLQVGDFAEAAKYFERFANDFPGEPDVFEALQSASMLRESLGQIDEAIKAQAKYMMLTKKKSESASAYFQVAEIRRRAGETEKALVAYQEYIRSFGNLGTKEHFLLAKGNLAAHAWKTKKASEPCKEVVMLADKWLSASDRELLNIYKELGSGLDVVAECQFYISEQSLAVFQKITLPPNASTEQFREWYEQIIKSREVATMSYLKVKEYGAKDWMLASLARIGEMSNAMAAAVAQTQASELAEALYSDASKAFSHCVEGAIQSNWYNEWSALCEENLQKLDPLVWPLLTEWVVPPLVEATVVVAPRMSGLGH
jgi:tetratricopeptide (TPR) repeat protein